MEVVYMPEAVPWKKRAKSIDWLARAGFQNIALDLRQYCPEHELGNREKVIEAAREHPEAEFVSLIPEMLSEKADKLIVQCRELHLENVIGIAPALPWNTEREDLGQLVHKITLLSIQACKRAHCQYIIINPPVKTMETAQQWEENVAFYRSLEAAAAEAELRMLVPNHYKEHNGHLVRCAFSDPYELSRFVDELNGGAGGSLYGICADVGICNLVGQNVYEFLKLLGDRVRAVVIRENNGIMDNALLPFSMTNKGISQMDWLGVFRGLRAIDFDGPAIFDFRGTSEAYSHLLRADFDVFIKKVTDYFAWQISMEQTIKKYDMRVLFGAGNMCRNYMKCYGEAYRPLFTCDNNQAIWGTKFEGLEIKNPEALKKLPAQCAIFICNVYYDEIERQIRGMGIENPIERFNDEYLPSMYMDRFDAEKREVI